MASGQIQMRKLDGRDALAQPIAPVSPDLAARSGPNSHGLRTPLGNCHQIRDTTRIRDALSCGLSDCNMERAA